MILHFCFQIRWWMHFLHTVISKCIDVRRYDVMRTFVWRWLKGSSTGACTTVTSDVPCVTATDTFVHCMTRMSLGSLITILWMGSSRGRSRLSTINARSFTVDTQQANVLTSQEHTARLHVCHTFSIHMYRSSNNSTGGVEEVHVQCICKLRAWRTIHPLLVNFSALWSNTKQKADPHTWG